jgi:hypothetical protein
MRVSATAENSALIDDNCTSLSATSSDLTKSS